MIEIPIWMAFAFGIPIAFLAIIGLLTISLMAVFIFLSYVSTKG